MSEEIQKDRSYFENIPLWDSNSSAKRFEILNDPQNGRIPVTRIESWKDFITLLQEPFCERLGSDLIYRGHRRFDWMLTPTLGRLKKNSIVTKDLADRQLTKFRKAIRGRVRDRSLLDNDEKQGDELWAIGQHHGLMTPLLDWTHSPYVALFFAFETPDVGDEIPDFAKNRGNLYRAVYILDKSFIGENGKCPEIRLVEPKKDDHGRLVNQAALFTYSPEDATIENEISDTFSKMLEDDEHFSEMDDDELARELSQYICKIYIRNEGRDDCLKQLRKMNVHHASLFPDVIGSSQYCNALIEEEESLVNGLKETAEVLNQLVNQTLPSIWNAK